MVTNDPMATTAIAALRESAARHAERIAIDDADGALTYEALFNEARDGAACLIRENLVPGERVVILAPHGGLQVTLLMSVWLARGTAIVLNAGESDEYLARSVASTGARILFTTAAAVENHPGLVHAFERVLDWGARAPGDQSADVSLPDPEPGDLALWLSTSGSTGAPKWIHASQATLLAGARAQNRIASPGPGDRQGWLAKANFMAGISTILAALLHGATLVPFEPKTRGLAAMAVWMRERRITWLHLLPGLFRRFCNELEAGQTFPDLHGLKLGGEPVNASDLRWWKPHFPGLVCLLHGLGMSEANGNLCQLQLREPGASGHRPTLPVGRPLPGVEILLLDENLRVVPDGQAGRIAFRCPWRAPGATPMEALTANLVHPWGRSESPPFLLTGDSGRWNESGELEFLGRVDSMIKVNGQRIEPARIESVLRLHPAVIDCAVVVREESTRMLVAWVATRGTAPHEEEWRLFLRSRLPASHLPARVIATASLPHTPAGKIDRRALTRMPLPALPVAVVPEDAIELAIVKAWKKWSRGKPVDTATRFDHLGGDSLAAASMLAKLEKKFLADLSIHDFLSDPTPRALARLVRDSTTDLSWQRMYRFREGGGGTPFFLVPPAGMGGRNPRRHQVAGPRPWFLWHYRGMDGVEVPSRSIPEMAADYLSCVRGQQPEGPYFLGGQSFGAMIALEAARWLRANGESVAMLVVVDSMLASGLRPRAGLGWRERMALRLLPLLPVGKRFYPTRRGLADGLRQAVRRFLVPWHRWRASRKEKPLPKSVRFEALLNACLAAKVAHGQPSPYAGPATVIRGRYTEAAALHEIAPALGWEDVVPDPVVVHLACEKGDDLFDQAAELALFEAVDGLLDRHDPATSPRDFQSRES